MTEIKRVKIDSIIESQIPEFLTEDSPLFVEFLKQYYYSLEHQSGALDLANNIKKYKSIENFNRRTLKESTILTSEVLTFDSIINVESTIGWPDKYGLLKINDEIITYTSKTETSFIDCVRGFSGIDQIKSTQKSEFLNFSKTNSSEHDSGDLVQNLSNLFLLEFFEKFRSEFFPGFESREFIDELSIQNILTRARDFYKSKGADSSYKLLFKILYGTDIEIIKPQEYTLVPSSNQYFITKNILVEKISGGNPEELPGNFLFQTLPGIGTVSASIFNVEYRPVANKDLYEISLDSTSFNGVFQASGKTRLVEDVQSGSDTILVDSTIGFSNSGKILVRTQLNELFELEYGDKTSTQFLNVNGITRNLSYGDEIIEQKFAISYIGFGNTSPINFRVINVIDNVDFSKTSNLRVGDRINLSGFGKDLSDVVEFNSWIYNIPTNHNILSSVRVSNNRYRLTLFDEVYFYSNEVVVLEDVNNRKVDANVISIEYDQSNRSKFSNRILVQVEETSFDVSQAKILNKKITKGKHQTNYFPEITKIPTGVQNTYIDSNNSTLYLTSTGLPSYTIFSTDNKKNVSTFGIGSTDTLQVLNHPYETGESIYYNPKNSVNSGIITGVYVVTKVDSNNIKLSYSRSDIFSQKYISVNSGITEDSIVKFGYENKTIKNQKLLKKVSLISTPIFEYDDENERFTTGANKQIGMLINGVELFSPTLFDEVIYYGKLDSVEVINSGSNYDVLDSPSIQVNDFSGSDAKCHLNISGNVKKVKILSPGVGYQIKPKITISGGNGKGCVLESNLVSSRIISNFKGNVNGVNLIDNTITTEDKILFDDGEEVIYNSNGNSSLLGIEDGSNYFVGIVTDNQLKLYNSVGDALSKSNEIDIVGISSGVHSFSSLKNKNTITEIYVKDPGNGYSNRSVRVPSILSADNKTTGINTFDSYILAKNHGFNTGEEVRYTFTEIPISGLSSDVSYLVDVINDDKFRLVSAGVGATLGNLNLLNKKYEPLNTLGVGTHIIAYPPIEIKIESISAIGSTTFIEPVLKPVILGSVEDVFLEDGGVSFGSTNIINFHRRPFIGISSISSEALLKPIVVNGKIVDVQIVNRGRGYRKDSDIIVSGTGSFAEIEPIIENGSIVGVIIVNSGVGYDQFKTQLTLKNRGERLQLLGNVTKWRLNQVEKLKNVISANDDGMVFPSPNPELGLQFINFYIPKTLRKQFSDNFTENDRETAENPEHSPILGYAYDGNPIYGPYGYETLLGGGIKRLSSGYIPKSSINPSLRPSSFEIGSFIEDYEFIGTGDLDEFNGRFCITPEYPDGTYAYFYTIDVDSTGRSRPVYPYIIGNKFKDNPIKENFLPKFNQDFSIFDTSLTRNTAPYYLNFSNSGYKLIDNVLKDYKQEFRVESVDFSGIESASVFSPGENYKVGDVVVLDNTDTKGSSTSIDVSRVLGKPISQFEIIDKKIEDIEFTIRSNNIIGESRSPHGLLNNQPVKISGVSTVTSSKLEGISIIKVNQKQSQLVGNIEDISVTGPSIKITVEDVSEFNVNDFIGIGTEIFLITKLSEKESSFDVNRFSNPGIHSFGDSVTLLPKKFEFLVEGNLVDFTFGNKTIFFNPKEDVGTGSIGTTRTVVGVSTSFSRFIPPRSIYLPNHKFFTGEELIYNCGAAGTSLFVNNVGSAVSFKLENNQKVYAVNLGRDYLGLSTVGFTTFTGIGSQFNSLEFRNLDQFFGVIGVAHSLTTLNPKITGSLESVFGKVVTLEKHNLTSGDIINLKLDISNTQEIKLHYDIVNRKLLANEISFSNSDVSLLDSSIDISSYNGEVATGDKVVYFGDSVIGGLQQYGIYYVLKDSFSKIKLASHLSDIRPILNTGEIKSINFNTTGGSDQKIYFVNPPIKIFKGNILKFDVSDSSLVDMDLVFYVDQKFTKQLEIIGSSEFGFPITREGIVGTPNSFVYIDTSNRDIPKVLYYTLVPKSPSEIEKIQISIDNSVTGFNKIEILNHSLNSDFKIDVNDDNTFTFQNNKNLTFSEINALNTASFSYDTNSKSTLGPISRLKINFPGRGYTKLPSVKEIRSISGNNAVIKLTSPKIGRVKEFTRIKDGFDYPTDPTLSPTLSVPTVAGIKNIRTIESIVIEFGGTNYNTPPTLVVPKNKNIILKSITSGGSVESVEVIKNSTEIASPLEIVSTRNSNGYDIDFITVSGNLVTIELLNTNLGTEFPFPFEIGDEIFIENCRLTRETRNLSNFNSVDYDYAFFTVVGVDTSNYTITYDISKILPRTFGIYEDSFGYGFVVNRKDMPILKMNLGDDVNYLSNEKVTTNKFSAFVMEDGWDGNLNQLRLIDCVGNLELESKLTGETSGIRGTIEYFDTFVLNSTLGVTRDKVGVVDNAIGILNDFQQRISDNFYYQKFSYSIKGDVPYNVWRESVRSIIHPAGFKEFSDLVVYSSPNNESISTKINLKPEILDSSSTLNVNIDTEVSMFDRFNFSRVYEEDSFPDGSVERIYIADGLTLRPYIINRTNKVLKIDDISDQFNGISYQELEGRFADASDLLKLNREFIQEEVIGFITFSYPSILSNPDWDEDICKRDVGFIVDAIAHDVKYQSNNKSVEAGLAYWDGVSNYVDGEVDETIAGFQYITELSKFIINNVAITTSYQQPVFSIPQEFDTRIIKDVSCSTLYSENCCANVQSAIVTYVGIITNIIGIGTASAPASEDIIFPSITRSGEIVGLTTFKLTNKGTSLFKHEFNTPSSKIDLVTNKFIIPNHNYQSGQKLIYQCESGQPIGIATTSYVTGITSTLMQVHNFDGTAIFENGYNVSISTSIIGISSTLVPPGPSFTQYTGLVGLGTLGVDAEFNAFITYNISTGQPISTSLILNRGGKGFQVGDIVSIAGTYLGGITPDNDLSFVVSKTFPTRIDGENNAVYTNVPSSDSSETTFNVSRDEDGLISTVEVLNGGSGYDIDSVISIAGTYIGGTGEDILIFTPSELGTTVLPREVYVNKLNDNEFRLSGLSTSVFFNLVGVGSGLHSLSYNDPDSSVIITIDGVIQSAIRRKSLEVSLSEPISTGNTTFIKISSGISSLAKNDIININNEFLLVKSIGLPTEDSVEIQRGYFGSVSTSHTTGIACTVLVGDYKIIGDVINFTTAPYGKIGPVGLETGSTFGGRVFSRQFDPSAPTDENIILDDISLSFTGVASTEFTLKSKGDSVTSLFNNINSDVIINNNPIILINNVFQSPGEKYVIENDIENEIKFIDGVPSSGKIVKVGVTTGFGYQPLLVASAQAVVSASGTISSITLTGSGSGYRTPPVVSIASTIGFGASVVSTIGLGGTVTGFNIINPGFGYTTSSLPSVIIGIPTGYSNLPLEYYESTGSGQGAKISVEVGMGSSIISFKFDQPGIGYKVGDKLTFTGILTNTSFRYDSLNISNVEYDNITGITTITTNSAHNIKENDYVILTGIAFTCGYDEVGIKTFSYDNATGICTVVTYSPHGLLRTDIDANKTSDEVFLFNLPFSCSVEHAGVTTTIFPDGTSPYGKVFPVLSTVGLNTFVMNAGISTIPHIFEGWPEIGISTFSYYEITGLSTVVTSTNHEFAVGDKITLAGLAFTCDSQYVGLTTTIFPDGTSEYGYTFTVTSVNSPTEFEFLAGISTIKHYYVGDGYTKKVPTSQRVLRYTDVSTDGAYDFRVTSVGSTNTFTILSGSISTIPHYYTQDGLVNFKQFEPFVLTVEEVQNDKFSGFYPGQFVKFADISGDFNGFRRRFTLFALIDGQERLINLRVPEGSDLDITNNIFIYLNDVLQVPGESYVFRGSRVIFTEPPREGSTCSIFYYRGSSIDVEEIVPPSTIKEGDSVIITENKEDPFDITQFDRVVKSVVSSDQFDTFTYDSIGINTDPIKERPLLWMKQKNDRIINGIVYSKARPDLKSNIRPYATVIKNISTEDEIVYVDNAYPIFSDIDLLSENLRQTILLEDREIDAAAAEAIVSTSSTVSNINVIYGGIGYANTSSPKISISASAIIKKDPIFNWTGGFGISPSYEMNSITYGNIFVGVGNTEALALSVDGQIWQSSVVGLATGPIDLKSIISIPFNTSHLYFSVGQDGNVIKSVGIGDSISSWSKIDLLEERSVPGFGVISIVGSSYSGELQDIVYSPSYDSYVTVGTAGSIFVGTGIGTNSLINRTSFTLSNLNSVTFSFNNSVNSGFFTIVGDNGVVLTSNSGQIWDIIPPVTTSNLNKVIFAEGRFVAVGNNGTVIKSISQSQFEFIPTNITANLMNISYNYGFYVALDDNGNLYYSFDLTSWVERSTNQFNLLKDIIFVDSLGIEGRYVSIGFGGTSIYAEPILNRATAESSVSSGIVTSIRVINGGFGYSPNNPPQLIIEPDTFSVELLKSIKVEGDFGTIIGINTFITGTPGIGTTTPKIEFVLKSETYDNTTLGIGYSSLNTFGISNSQLQKGDYFVITDSNVTVGHAITGITTSLGGMSNYPFSKVGTAVSYIDGVYRVESVTTPTLGIVTVTCNLAPSPFGNFVQIYQRGSDNSGINTNNFYGKYSWGKIFDYQNRILNNPKSFRSYTDNGLVGLTTSTKVIRTRSLVSK